MALTTLKQRKPAEPRGTGAAAKIRESSYARVSISECTRAPGDVKGDRARTRVSRGGAR